MKIPFLSTAINSDSNRLIAVGDIHGCLESLRRLMKKVKPQVGDRVVFLGDYVDRGPDSRGVIEFLIDFKNRFPLAVFLKGNHEEMFLDYLQGRNREFFLLNNGASTLRHYRSGVDEEVRLPPEHCDFLNSLRPFYQTEDFFFVHAGLRPQIPVEKQQEQDMLWIREEFLGSDYDWGVTVVFGHTPLKNPLQKKDRLGLDTGAVYGGKLTACDVRKRCFWSVRGEKNKKFI